MVVIAIFMQVAAKVCRVQLMIIGFFCAVVLEWRKTKQQKLTCITAPTVRLHMGHLSVSEHSLCVLVIALLDYIYFPVHFFNVYFKLVRKRRGGNKQPDYGASGTRVPTRPVKTGSSQFVRELRSRTFPK